MWQAPAPFFGSVAEQPEDEANAEDDFALHQMMQSQRFAANGSSLPLGVEQDGDGGLGRADDELMMMGMKDGGLTAEAMYMLGGSVSGGGHP